MEEKHGGGGGRTKGIGGGGNTSGLGEEDARSDWMAAARVFDRALRLLSHAVSVGAGTARSEATPRKRRVVSLQNGPRDFWTHRQRPIGAVKIVRQ